MRLLIVPLLPLLASLHSHAGAEPWHSEAFDAMATRVEVVLPARHAPATRFVRKTFAHVEEQMNEWRPTSPLGALNAAAGGEPVPIPADLRGLLHRGVTLGNRTDGAFDITWAALWGLWDFGTGTPSVPTQEDIDRRVGLVDYRALEIDDGAGTARLPHAGMKVGLGGIAKGYALERAADALRAAGVTRFLLSAGGQIYAGGARDGRPWRVGVRDPRGGPADWFAVLEVTDASVSTSGDYERYFEVDGVRYHHVLDPRTGRPAVGTRSATVIAKDPALADALSTALMVLGAERGVALVEGYEDVEAMVVDHDGNVHMSGGAGRYVVDLRLPRR